MHLHGARLIHRDAIARLHNDCSWTLARIGSAFLALVPIGAELCRTCVGIAANAATAWLPATGCWARCWSRRWAWCRCWSWARSRSTASWAIDRPRVVRACGAGVQAIVIVVRVGICVRAVSMDALCVLHGCRRTCAALFWSPGRAAVWLANGVRRGVRAVWIAPVACSELGAW